MAITAVGSPVVVTSSASSFTVPVSPVNLGDMLVVLVNGGAGPVNTPTGGGVTTWNQVSNAFTNYQQMFWGVVTATGSSNITFTINPGYSAVWVQEFAGGSGTWALDSSSSNTVNTTSGDYPSLSPTGTEEVYIGFLVAQYAPDAGSSTGYVYDNNWASSASSVYFLNATTPNSYNPAWSQASYGAAYLMAGAFSFTPSAVAASGNLLATFLAAVNTGGIVAQSSLKATFLAEISTNTGYAPTDLVPWELPVSINDHPYMLDFEKSRITTMQVRRQASDNSVEPGEQTLSIAGVWPRAQDNYFLGAGQEFLDNRFAFESVYVHSGEYPSVRTRFWKSQGVNPWHEGKLTLHNEQHSIATSTLNLLIIVCGNYLYKTDGTKLWWTLSPVGTASPTFTEVTSSNTHNIVSLATDGSRVWAACGADGVYVTVAGTTTWAAAATPAALNGIGGAHASVGSVGTVDATNLPGSTTINYYITEVDAFGNETAAVNVTAVQGTTPYPVSLTWNPDGNATDFKVRRNIGGSDLLVYTGDTPAFVDDGTVAGTTSAHPTTNGTGSTAYTATFLVYAKGHLLASTGRDLVEILASGNTTFIFQHENPSFVFTCGTECPSAILVGGYAGSVSYVGSIQPDAANAGATLAPPVWATTLTPGEQINALSYDAGAMLLGTSLGIRSGTKPDSLGVFDVNPVIEDPGAVLCVASWSQYEYFGWSNYNPTETWAARSTVSGLGRADLSQYTTPGVPAYATDVMSAAGGTTTQVVVMAGQPYFVVLNSGTYTLYGADGNLVSSGWMEPGWVRYGTLENKIVVEIDFQHEPLPAGSSVNYKIVDEDGLTVNNIVTNSTANSTTLQDPFSAGLIAGDRFMPIITLTATADQSAGPVFHSHITKAMVTTKRQDEILLALVWADRVQTVGPSTKTFEMDPKAEYDYLKNLEGTGDTVNLTILDDVRVAYIDQILMEPTGVSDQRSWFTGTCTVKLISLSL